VLFWANLCGASLEQYDRFWQLHLQFLSPFHCILDLSWLILELWVKNCLFLRFESSLEDAWGMWLYLVWWLPQSLGLGLELRLSVVWILESYLLWRGLISTLSDLFVARLFLDIPFLVLRSLWIWLRTKGRVLGTLTYFLERHAKLIEITLDLSQAFQSLGLHFSWADSTSIDISTL
jgi:hypothetical protein